MNNKKVKDLAKWVRRNMGRNLAKSGRAEVRIASVGMYGFPGDEVLDIQVMVGGEEIWLKVRSDRPETE
jgi:hypothetical protein